MIECATTLAFGAADAITLGIACLGAITGIIALTLNVYQFKVSGPRIRVETVPARFGPTSRLIGGTWNSSTDPDTLAQHPVLAIAVHAINYGRMPTIIESWGVDVGGDLHLRSLNHPANPELPIKIEAGQRLTFFADLGDVDAGNHAAAKSQGADRGKVRGVITLGDGTSTKDKTTLALPRP